LNFYLVFLISMELFGHWTRPTRYVLSLANAAAGCYGAVNILEVGTTIGDNLMSIPVLAGLLIVIRRLAPGLAGEPSNPLRLWIAGAAIGFAFALKLTLAIYVAGVAVSLPIVWLYAGNQMRRRFTAASVPASQRVTASGDSICGKATVIRFSRI
jgi:hypothetical protein